MQHSLEFVLGLLDGRFPAYVSAEDFAGEHGPMLRLWQRLGFLSCEAESNPVPSCSHCLEGVPYLLGGRYLCGSCQSQIDPEHLKLWRFKLEVFLAWLARKLKMGSGIRQVDESLWQMGSFTHGGLVHGCFFRCGDSLSDQGRNRLLAYRNVLLLERLPGGAAIEGFHGVRLSLLEVLRQDRRSLKVTDLMQLLHGSRVRFDAATGGIVAGENWLGEVPVGSKEYHLLACLWRQVDRFVPYADLKHYVLGQSGSTDTTDEATFCHKLKGRIKDRRFIPKIDFLIATTNKGDGYRLRGHLGEA